MTERLFLRSTPRFLMLQRSLREHSYCRMLSLETVRSPSKL
ncbi:MAG TPA: hypothetical protein VGE47_10825 [Burkholderiaceae bacterium]